MSEPSPVKIFPKVTMSSTLSPFMSASARPKELPAIFCGHPESTSPCRFKTETWLRVITISSCRSSPTTLPETSEKAPDDVIFSHNRLPRGSSATNLPPLRIGEHLKIPGPNVHVRAPVVTLSNIRFEPTLTGHTRAFPPISTGDHNNPSPDG